MWFNFLFDSDKYRFKYALPRGVVFTRDVNGLLQSADADEALCVKDLSASAPATEARGDASAWIFHHEKIFGLVETVT